MWWRSASFLGVILALVLTGCGFHPLYGSRNGIRDTQNQEKFALVHISPIEDHSGLILRNALEDRMHPDSGATDPKYRLQVMLQQTNKGINYQKNATASAGEITMTATWQLLDFQTGQRLAYGKFNSVDSVNYLGPRYASVASDQDAQNRSLNDIADMITDRIAVYLTQHP